MNCKYPELYKPDTVIGGDDVEKVVVPCPSSHSFPPVQLPKDGGIDYLVSEGCVGVALLSLAATIISLILLKGK